VGTFIKENEMKQILIIVLFATALLGCKHVEDYSTYSITTFKSTESPALLFLRYLKPQFSDSASLRVTSPVLVALSPSKQIEMCGMAESDSVSERIYWVKTDSSGSVIDNGEGISRDEITEHCKLIVDAANH
jgi:hypothetical protein